MITSFELYNWRNFKFNGDPFDYKNYIQDYMEINFDDDSEDNLLKNCKDDINLIIDNYKNIKFPLTIYRGINVKDEKEIIYSSDVIYDGVSWTYCENIAKHYNHILTGLIYSYNDFNIRQSITRSILHSSLNECEIVIYNWDNIKNIKVNK